MPYAYDGSAMPSAYDGADDPFGGGRKTPSLSWKNLPIGSEFTLEIQEPARLLQSRNYDSNQLDYWDDAKTQPRMAAVLNVKVLAGSHSVGELRSVWAQKPSSLFVAIADAQKVSQSRIDVGGILRLRFVSQKVHEDKKKNPIKQYAAHYTPPVLDAFGAASPASPAAPGGSGPSAPPRSASSPLTGSRQGDTIPSGSADIPF